MLDQISEFILNLNDELNNIETIKSVIDKARIHGNWSLLGGSEVALDNRENVLLNLIAGFQNEGVFLLSLDIFPESNLIVRGDGLWNQISGGVEAQMSLEVSPLHVEKGLAEVFCISATTEADVGVSFDDSW